MHVHLCWLWKDKMQVQINPNHVILFHKKFLLPLIYIRLNSRNVSESIFQSNTKTFLWPRI